MSGLVSLPQCLHELAADMRNGAFDRWFDEETRGMTTTNPCLEMCEEEIAKDPSLKEKYALALLDVLFPGREYSVTTMDPGIYRGNYVGMRFTSHDLFEMATATQEQRSKAMRKVVEYLEGKKGRT